MDNVRLTKEGPVSVLTIDRPEVMNALDSDTRTEMTSALQDLRGDDSTRAVVVTGAGDRAFSAGQDINESKNFEGEEAKDWVEEFDSLYEAIVGLDVPVVAKLNGVAIGSAFQVALLCDLRIASEDAEVGMNEINIGIPCILGSWIIESIAGYVPAAEITLTGEPVTAARAKELGLINQVVPDDELDDTVEERVGMLAEKPPVSMRWQKKWLRELRFDEALRDVSQRGKEIHSEVYESGEPEEYMGQFLGET